MKLYCLCQITGQVPKEAVDSQGFGPHDNQVFMAPNRLGTNGQGLDDKGQQIFKDYAVDTHGSPTRPVLLAESMEVKYVGVAQEVVEKGGRPPRNEWLTKTADGVRLEKLNEQNEIFRTARQHYPNVDIYKCKTCGAMVVLEG